MKTMTSPTHGEIDLVYSLDDGGWYGQLWANMDMVTDIYPTEWELRASILNGEAVFTDSYGNEVAAE
jgi:hypothetical protein